MEFLPIKSPPKVRRLTKQKIAWIKQESKRQNAQWKDLMRVISATKLQSTQYKRWLYTNDEMWNGIAAACGKEKLEKLASELGLDAGVDPPRIIFLTGLATLITYKMAWEIVTESSTGCVRKRLLEIYQLERKINEQIMEIVSGAKICFRGTSIDEVRNMLEGHPGYGDHPFVSMTMSPQKGVEFAVEPDKHRRCDRLVMVLEASCIHNPDIEIAQYSIAAEALDMNRPAVNVRRMFMFLWTHEAQAHIVGSWPSDASDALLAIVPAGESSKNALDEMNSTGISVIWPDGTEDLCWHENAAMKYEFPG